MDDPRMSDSTDNKEDHSSSEILDSAAAALEADQDVSVSPVKIRADIVAMASYSQGRPAPDNGFKLSSNESPFPPLPSVVAAIEAAGEDGNRYPDASAQSLVSRLAMLNQVSDSQIVAGPGSISVLSSVITAIADHDIDGQRAEVVYPWRSFEGYTTVLTLAGVEQVPVPLTESGEHDLDAMLAAVTDRTRAVMLCSPNNPNGKVLRHDDVERFLAQLPKDILVILDEAYVEFVRDEDSVDGAALIADHQNVVTLRTLSKAYGLAGLRVGYAVGHPAIIAAIRACILPFALSNVSIAAANAVLDGREDMLEEVEDIVQRRGQIAAQP